MDGKYNNNNFQAVFKSWKRHHSWSILDQPTYHFIEYFNCCVPARKLNNRHGQYCSNKQHGRENSKKLKLETLFPSFGANI